MSGTVFDRPARRAGVAGVLLMLAYAGVEAALPSSVERLAISSDVPAAFNGIAAGGAAVLQATPSGTVLAADPLPAALSAGQANLIALAWQETAGEPQRWLVLDVAYAPALSPAVDAGMPFRCLDHACDTVDLLPLPAFDDGVGVSALAFDLDGSPLLVLDNGSSVNGQAYPAGTVLRCAAGACEPVLPASALPDGVRIDALEVLADGRWLVSFDVGGSIDEVGFADHDVLLFDGAGWMPGLRPAAAAAAWQAANLDALAAPPAAVADALFRDGFEGAVSRR